MISILGQLALDDLSNFLSVFATQGVGIDRTEGNRNCHLYSVSQNEKRVVVLFEWTSLEAWHAFLDDEQVQEVLSGSAGKRPRFTVLEKVGEFQGFGQSGRASKFITPFRDFVALGAPIEELITAQILAKAHIKDEALTRQATLQVRDEGGEEQINPVSRKLLSLLGV